MILKLKSPLLLIIFSLLFFSCEKEYSLEGNVIGNTSVFTLTGGQGSCTNAVVTGSYQAGVALGATNVVTVAVDVTTTGNYTISTAVINGISFTGSGSFTVTGAQTISLAGSGIPVSGGAFTFVPGANGCSFPVVVSSGPAGSPSVFTYNGGTGTCTNAVPADQYFVGTALTAANTVTIDVNVTTIGSWSVSTPVVNGFSFAGSGNFAAIGASTITLTGNGTPVTQGVSDFIPTNGCAFQITVLTGTVATDFLKCTIDGVAKTFNVGATATGPLTSTFVIGGNETSGANTQQFEIDLTKSPSIGTGVYDKFSATNTSTYCIAAFNDGVAATPWYVGLLQAGGFSVNVTSIAGNRIDGTFSGTLYDNNGLGSGAKVITAGQFSLPY